MGLDLEEEDLKVERLMAMIKLGKAVGNPIFRL